MPDGRARVILDGEAENEATATAGRLRRVIQEMAELLRVASQPGHDVAAVITAAALALPRRRPHRARPDRFSAR